MDHTKYLSIYQTIKIFNPNTTITLVSHDSSDTHIFVYVEYTRSLVD